MLSLANNSYCFKWETPIVYPTSSSYGHVEEPAKKTTDYYKFFKIEEAEDDISDFSPISLRTHSFKFNENAWHLKTVQELIEKANNLKDDEISYPVYEILGLEYWKSKDYDQALMWFHKGIKKGEPTCMRLLEKLNEISLPPNINDLRKNLKQSVEKRIQKLMQKNDNSETLHKATLVRLQEWVKEEEQILLTQARNYQRDILFAAKAFVEFLSIFLR